MGSASFHIKHHGCEVRVSLIVISLLAIFIKPTSAIYDPEQQDGIPVLSARTLEPRPADDWLNHDDETHQHRAQARSLSRPLLASQRRNSDADLDDGLEDEDDDEYQSGSNQHEHIEPSYGESRRSAKDADDIETFFDRHLGPPEEQGSATESATSEVPVHRSPAGGVDPDDDMYETAASSPLVSVIQSLFGGQKSPLVTLEASGTGKEPSEQADSSTKLLDQQATDGSGSIFPTITIHHSSPSVSSAATADQSPNVLSSLLMPMITKSPASSSDNHDITSTSASSDYHGHQTETSGDESQSVSGQDQPGEQVQEIYIGRRPHVANLLKQAALKQQLQPIPEEMGIATASSAGRGQIWRLYPSQMDAANEGYATYLPVPGHNYRNQMVDAASVYPTSIFQAGLGPSKWPMAASYSHQLELPTQPGGSGNDENQDNDDDQTVTYGLSLGGSRSSSVLSADSPDEQSSGDDSSPLDHQSSYYSRPETQHPFKVSSSRLRQIDQANYDNLRIPPGQYNQMALMMQQQQRRQQQLQRQRQGPYYGARYHSDPSELAYHRAQNNMRPAQHTKRNKKGYMSNRVPMDRQQLLASLNQQIRASPMFVGRAHGGGVRGSQATWSMPVGSSGLTMNQNKRPLNGEDVDTFDSFHAEVDPYKTITSSSRMIRYPKGQLFIKQQVNGNRLMGKSPVESNQAIDPAESGSSRVFESSKSLNKQTKMGQNSTLSQQQFQTGPLINGQDDYDHPATNDDQPRQQQPHQIDAAKVTGPEDGDDLAVRQDGSNTDVSNVNDILRNHNVKQLMRFRRDDSEERDSADDGDDDAGVWVDDDEDDDGRQQSSDLNETTAQEAPEADDSYESDERNDDTNHQPTQVNPPGVIGGPHGYELSPNDLMIYHG